MLVDRVTSAPAHLHEAVVQDSAAAMRAPIVDQERHLERSQRVGDISFNVVLLKPISSGLGIAEVDTDSPAARTCPLQGLDDGIGRVEVVVHAVYPPVLDDVPIAGE